MRSLWILVCFGILSASALSAANIFSPNGLGSVSIAFPRPTPARDAPSFKAYRGVAIRMPATQVAEKLGVPTQKTKAGDYYAVSPTESVQISYDADQQVKSISINLTGDLRTAPTPKDVVGTDIKKEPDGTMSKMVSFTKDGYWASYTRTGGKDATIIITLQKLDP